MKLSKYDILNNAKLSFTVSFRCNKKAIAHFKDYDFSDCNGEWYVSTDMKPYGLAKIELAKLLTLVSNHTETSWNDTLIVYISFDENISKIYQINPLKLVLSFNENYLYDIFPDRKNRVGSRSVKKLIKPGVTKDSISAQLENKNNIYGIDLSNKGSNIISYRYIGGKNYEKKYTEISGIIDKWIVDTYTVIENPEYTQDEISELSAMTKNIVSIDSFFISYENFKNQYKNINLLVDLNPINGIDNIYWPVIKDRMKDLIKSTSMSEDIKMTINYDSDSGKLQIKDTKLYGICGLNDVELIDCIITGEISNSSLYYTSVTNTKAEYCNFFTGCDIIKSMVHNCYIADGVSVDDSTIYGDSTIANGELSKCNIASGVKYTKYTHFKDCKNKGSKI